MITLKGNIANLEGTSSDQKPNNVPVNTIFRELDTNCSYYFTGEAWVEIPSSGGGGGGGTDSYNDLENKPQINSVTLSGNKSLANLGIQGELTFDNSPTEDSTNPVTSGGVYSALETKQNTLTIDSIPTESSTNPVESGGVYNALGNKQDTLTFDGTYNASTNKAATESTVSGAVSTAIGNLSKSDVGLDNVTNNAQVKAVSGSVTNGGIATFGADGATVADSGKTIETSLTDTNDKLPTSKAIRDNVAANATLASGYTVDTSETSITSSTKINDAIEQLDYRTATNKTNILLIADQSTQYNLADCSLDKLKTYTEYGVGTPVWSGNTFSNNNKTFTVNGDGSITVSGTTANDTGRMTVYEGDISAGSFIKGCPEGGAVSGGYLMAVYNSAGQSQAIDIGNGAIVNSNLTNAYIQIAVPKTVEIDSKVFKPMIIPKALYDGGITNYQPYALPNTTLTPALVECVDNGAKNKIPISKMTTVVQTTGNITFTPNADGTFTATATGTNSSTTNFYIAQGLTANEVKNGDYMSGCPSNTDGIYLNVQMEVDPYTRTGKDYGSGEVIEGISSSYTYRVVCTIPANINPNNKIFKPMICSGADWAVSKTYEPPVMSNAELTEKVNGIRYTLRFSGNPNPAVFEISYDSIPDGVYLVTYICSQDSSTRRGTSVYMLTKYTTNHVVLWNAVSEVANATITSVAVGGSSGSETLVFTMAQRGYHTCKAIYIGNV